MSARYIARKLKLARSTVAAVLERQHMGKLKQLDPKEPVRRFERVAPGEPLNLDIEKQAEFDQAGHRITDNRRVNSRGAQWEFVHVCADDYTRLAYAVVLQDEMVETAAAFLERATKHLQKLGVTVNQVMINNGACYRSKVLRKTCKRFDLRYLFTRPYRPQTNGKAERFIQALIYEGAHAREYQTSDERKGHMPRWLYYNQERDHGSLDDRLPITRLRVRFCEQRS